MKTVNLLFLVVAVLVAPFCRAVEPVSVKLGEATLSIYSPAQPNGAAVLICPGGGYQKVCIDKEGYLFAPYFNEKGITLAVLDYRLPKGDPTVPFADSFAALRYLHENAAMLKLNPEKIGIMGGSAGGHLAATTAVLAPKEIAPRFQILLYPVISMVDMSLSHRGSREHLMGDKAYEPAALLEYSPEHHVTPETGDAFIVLTADDGIVDPENSIVYARALGRCGVGCELIMFPHGPHGFGANEIEFRSTWLATLSQWLDSTVLSK